VREITRGLLLSSDDKKEIETEIARLNCSTLTNDYINICSKFTGLFFLGGERCCDQGPRPEVSPNPKSINSFHDCAVYNITVYARL
jgi:hypothetical protein